MLKKIGIVLVLSVIFFATSWSIFRPELFRVHDYVHAARIAEMARGLIDGQIPVRWSANFGYGYGMPLFEFYAPLPYALGAIVWMLGIPIDYAVRLLFIFPSLLTIMVAYALGRMWFSRSTALIVSAAVSLAPYRAVNLFVRGAVAEAWGMAFLLVTLLGICYLVRKKKYSSVLFGCGLIGMILSHNLTSLVAAPLIIVWFLGMIIEESLHKSFSISAVWLELTQQYKGRIITFLLTSVLALGITAFYWLPALLERQFTQMDSTIVSGYFDFRLHFLSPKQFFQSSWGYGGSNWGPQDGISFFLGYGQIIGSILTVVTVLANLIIRKPLLKAVGKYSLIAVACTTGLILLVSLFLAIQRSSSIWELLPILHILQFPWRFLLIASAMIGIFCVIWLEFLPTRFKIREIAIVATLLVLIFNVQYFQPESYLTSNSELYYTDAERIKNEMSKVLPDFIPKDFHLSQPSHSLLVCEPLDNCNVQKVLIHKSNEMRISATVTQDSIVNLSTAAYPGWVVLVDGLKYPSTVASDGRVQLQLTQGEHDVYWYFGNTRVRSIADSISAITIIIVLLLCGGRYMYKLKSKQ